MVLLTDESEMLVRVNIHSEVFTLQSGIANHKEAFLCKHKNIRIFIATFYIILWIKLKVTIRALFEKPIQYVLCRNTFLGTLGIKKT